MERLAGWLNSTAHWLVNDFGLFGLFVVAFFDSSFLSLPEINDILVITMSMHEPDRLAFFAGTATAGSVLGCVALYTVGRKGGRPLLRKKLSPERLQRLERTLRRFDILAVLVPSLLPPPCPFKVFVLASGVFGMRLPRFALAVLAGRSIRYFTEGFLAVRYGRTLARLHDDLPEIALAVVVLFVVLWILRRRAVRPDVPPAGSDAG